MRADKTSVFVVFVRDHADALLSLFNDKGSSGFTHLGADAWVRLNVDDSRFDYYATYMTLINARVPQSQIVTVFTRDLRTLSGVSTIIRSIEHARGLRRKKYRVIYSNSATDVDGRHTHQNITAGTRDYVRAHWEARDNLFRKISHTGELWHREI
jgi:hypothetical protein